MARLVLNPKSTGVITFADTEAHLTSGGTPGTTLFQGEDQCIDFKFVPKSNVVSAPASFSAGKSDVQAASGWELRVSLLQDWGKTISLSQFLFDNDSEAWWVMYVPAVPGTGTDSIKANIYLVGGAYGGKADENWVDDLVFPCVVKPVLL